MSKTWKIILTLLGSAYVLSPYDGLPDLVPGLGQADDLFVIFAILTYIWKIPILKYLWGNRKAGEKPGPGRERESSSKPPPEEEPSSAQDPWQVLGVGRNAGPEEIKTAYRRASRMYHPDKVAHLGPEFQRLAQKKFVEIQKAYEYLIKGGPRP